MTGLLRLAGAESRRFGLRVARGGEAAAADPLALVDACVAQRIDVAILRIDAAGCGAGAALAATGLAPLHADTLSTWAFDLARAASPRALPAAGPLRPAAAGDREGIARLVRRAFAAYPNHYRANPLFDPGAAIEGYVEWALTHLDGAGHDCWVHAEAGAIAGLACTARDAAAGRASGNLHGVDPDHGRRGIYRAMIAATIDHCAALGLRELSIATQAGNLSVQRTWARLGFAPVRSEHTYHLEPLAGRLLAAEGVAPGPGLATGEALRRAHARAFGDAALADLRLRVVRDGSAVHRIHAAAVPRHAGGRRAASLALDHDQRVVGWAVTDRID